MQIYFHSRLWSYLPRVPILVEDTVSLQTSKDFSLASFSVVECRAEIRPRRKMIRDEKIIQECLKKIGKRTDV